MRRSVTARRCRSKLENRRGEVRLFRTGRRVEAL